MIELRKVNITPKSPPYFQRDEISREIRWTLLMNLDWMGAMRKETLERKGKMSNVYILHVCTHMCLHIYMQTHKLHVRFMLVCTYSYLYTYVCTEFTEHSQTNTHQMCWFWALQGKDYYGEANETGLLRTLVILPGVLIFGGHSLCFAYVYFGLEETQDNIITAS